MDRDLVKNEYFIQPGYLCVPQKATLLYTVVGSGVVITIYDPKNKRGGMSHYIKPHRKNKKINTPDFAYPAIIGLLNFLTENGSSLSDLEAHIIGGSENSNIKGYIKGLAELNVNAAKEILKRKNINIQGIDTGSGRGRKVMFNTESGEIITARVNKIRTSDWYPTV